MNSVKFICDNFVSIFYVKDGLLLYGDSGFDENKNKVSLKVTIISYTRNIERFSRFIFD